MKDNNIRLFKKRERVTRADTLHPLRNMQNKSKD